LVIKIEAILSTKNDVNLKMALPKCKVELVKAGP